MVPITRRVSTFLVFLNDMIWYDSLLRLFCHLGCRILKAISGVNLLEMTLKGGIVTLYPYQVHNIHSCSFGWDNLYTVSTLVKDITYIDAVMVLDYLYIVECLTLPSTLHTQLQLWM